MAEPMDHERLYLSLEKALDRFIIRTEKVVDKIEIRVKSLEDWKTSVLVDIGMNTKSREGNEQLGHKAKVTVIDLVIKGLFALIVLGFLAWVALNK